MNTRKVLILFLSLFTISIFFSSQAYSHWYEERISSFLNEYYDELDNMTLEKRKVIRWGASYQACIIMKDYIKKDSIKNPLLLAPPASYNFKFMPGFSIVEPVTFYYFCGLRTTTREGKDLNKATYAIHADRAGQPLLITIHNSDDLKASLKEFEAKQPQQ